MKKKTSRTIFRIAQKILLLTFIAGFSFVGSTNAFLTDTEVSDTNTFQASSLDMSLRDTSDTVITSPLFSVNNLKPGITHTANMRVKKEGAEDFQYTMEVTQTGGDDALCDALQIIANAEGTDIYAGSLYALTLSSPVVISAVMDDWAFTVGLVDTDYALQNKTCSFDLHVKGWQIDSDGTWGLTDEEYVSNTVSTGRWQPPAIPILVSPTDGTIRNTEGMVMDWSDVTDPDGPVTYIYQSAYDSAFASVAYTSTPLSNSNIPASGTPDGMYWWHVKACNINACSSWSAPWRVIVDNTKPSSIITTGYNPNTNNEALKLHTHYITTFDWNGIIDGSASDSVGVKEVRLSIHRPILNLYWDGSNWVSGSETSVRVLVSGSTTWTYPLSNHPTGAYVIKSHAVDFAGNTEDTFTLYLDYQEAQPTASISLSNDHQTSDIRVEHITGFDRLDYTLEYATNGTTKGITGTDLDISHTSLFEKGGLDLATCSADGCTYDGNVHDFVLNVTLKKIDGSAIHVTAKK